MAESNPLIQDKGTNDCDLDDPITPYYYLVYYELHDLKWEADPRIVFKDRNTDTEIRIGKWLYFVPDIA